MKFTICFFCVLCHWYRLFWKMNMEYGYALIFAVSNWLQTFNYVTWVSFDWHCSSQNLYASLLGKWLNAIFANINGLENLSDRFFWTILSKLLIIFKFKYGLNWIGIQIITTSDIKQTKSMLKKVEMQIFELNTN